MGRFPSLLCTSSSRRTTCCRSPSPRLLLVVGLLTSLQRTLAATSSVMLKMPQAKVGEAREASGGDLPDALRAAVADNERLNQQLHVLHGNAAQLRQAIADARSLQSHLQQQAADASGSRQLSR